MALIVVIIAVNTFDVVCTVDVAMACSGVLGSVASVIGFDVTTTWVVVCPSVDRVVLTMDLKTKLITTLKIFVL